MYFIHRFVDGMRVARRIEDWGSTRFGWDKAYASSVMSLAAYEHLSQYEIMDAPRAKLIPSDSYQHAVWQERRTDLAEEMRRNDINVLEIVDQPRVVAIVANIGKVVFIALRGTQSLYDVFTDLSVPKTRGFPDASVRLHSGFARAVDSCITAVCARLLESVSSTTPVCVTGHSLGGAMAAIMHARLHYAIRLQGAERSNLAQRHPVSCFVFGMPRYGNAAAVQLLANPFHVYNVADLVPTVPNRLFGYSDLKQGREFCLGGGCKLLRSHRKGSGGILLKWGSRKVLGLGEHRMECYVSRLEVAFRLGLAVS